MFTLIVLTEESYHLRQFANEKDLGDAFDTVVQSGQHQGLVNAAGYKQTTKSGELIFHWPEGEVEG